MARRIRRSRRRTRRRVRGPRRIRMRKSTRITKRKFRVHKYKRYSECVIYADGTNYVSSNPTLMACQYIDANDTTYAGNPLLPPPTVVTSNGGLINLACNFSLDRVTAYQDLQALYDRYRIDGVKISMMPCNTVSTTGGSNPAMPQYRCHRDDDSSALIASQADLYQFSERADVRMGTMARGFKQYIANPKQKTTAVDRSGANQGGAIMIKSLVDMAVPNIAHYGFKMIIQDVPRPNAISPLTTVLLVPYYRIRFTYYITCLDTR